jgi:CheY-like chemotaxis protein
MKKIQRIIMVDDDPYSQMICNHILRKVAGGIEFLKFTLPEKGIEYIESAYNIAANDCPTILLLDINMPIMSGWDFLERYDKAESDIKNQLTIYLLSSSIDQHDKARAAENKYIKAFLTKPFRKEMVETILKNCLTEKMTS